MELAELYVEGKATLQDLELAGSRLLDGGLRDQWRRCYERYKYLERTHDCEPEYKQEISDAWDASAKADAAFHRCKAVKATTLPNALDSACMRYGWEPYTSAGAAVERTPSYDVRLVENVCELIREIFRPPANSLLTDNPFLTRLDSDEYSDARKLCVAAYDERTLPEGILDGERLVLAAEALERAGCTHQELVAHLRAAGPHVRGCWAVDLVLGKK